MAQFQNSLIAILSVSVVLGIMIFVHEWGHFIAAKLLGVRVDVFSFGFGTRLAGVKRGDTDYRISALPFGGYVRMAGDNPSEERTGADYEFLSKSRWARFLIAVAGPIMNIILAFLIFWGIFWFAGVPTPSYLREAADVAAVPQYSPAPSAIQAGDRIVSINGTQTPTWAKVSTALGTVKPGDSLTFVVLRNGAQQTVTETVPATPKTDGSDLVGYPALPMVAEEIAIGTPAEKAGLQPGDEFVSVNGHSIATWIQLVDAVHNSDGHAVQFVVRRKGSEMPFSIEPQKGMGADGQPVWQIGVLPKTKDDFLKQSFGESIKDAGFATSNGVRQIVEVLGGLFTGKVSVRQLQGVVGIARESGRAAKRGFLDLILLMAVISLNLGLLNLLPIPILDGGHVLLLAIEGTLRRDLSLAVKERFVQVGLVFLLGVFAFVMYSDILKLIQSH
jgi:regulator of sigma E protease